MKAEELHDKFIDLGNKYIERIISKIKKDKNFNSLKVKHLEVLKKSNQSSTHLFLLTKIQNELLTYYRENIIEPKSLSQIQTIFNELVYKSDEENFVFFGCNSRISIKYYNEYLEDNVNPVMDIEIGDVCITLLNELNSNELYLMPTSNILDDSIEDFEFHAEFSYPYHCLNHEQVEYLNRSFYRKKKFLLDKGNIIEPDFEKELQNTKRKQKETLHKGALYEPVNVSSWEKTLYLEELGIISMLKNTYSMSNEQIGRVLNKVIPNNKPSTLAKYVGKIITDKNLHPNDYHDETWKKVREFLKEQGVNLAQ